MENKKENEIKKEGLFDNANKLVNLIIVLILIIILLSQTWAINGNLSTNMVIRSILNHNSFYFLLLIYFLGVKLYIGKMYFNYLNLFLMVLYLINTVTSIFTLVQTFTLNSLLLVLINIVIFIYLFHTMLRGTRVWKDYKLKNSPFNEISNDWYYNFLFIVPTILFIVNLISAVSLSGCALYLLDYIYILLFARYIYLYREFLDSKSINSKNKGNFDDIKVMISDKADEFKDKVDGFVEENKIDEKIDKVKDKVIDTTNDIKDKVDDFIEDNKIDEKLDKAKDKVVDTTMDIRDVVEDLIDDEGKEKKKKKKKTTKKKGSE